VKGALLSPRRRKRLAWGTVAVAVIAVTIGAGLKWPNTSERPPEQYSAQPAQVYREPERVELTRIERAKALATAANFVTHAVARRKEEQSYDLTAPSLRGGISRTEWRAGNIPVVPYPVDHARWKLDYSYERAIGLQVLLFPTPKSGLRPEVFNMELTSAGRGKARRWLVSSWAPSDVIGAGAAPPATASAGPGGVPNIGAARPDNRDAQLGAGWLLAPLALFAIVPLLVGGFYFRSWRRGRRAEAAYRARTS
jgi:hypothetical protein